MLKHFVTATILAATFTSCRTTTASTSLEAVNPAAKAKGTFVCVYEKDSTSIRARPKQMTDKVQVTILAPSISNVSMKVSVIGQPDMTGKLKSISGDEGYTEFTVPKDISDKFGFDYVNVNYDEEDSKHTPTHATLINGADFARCE